MKMFKKKRMAIAVSLAMMALFATTAFADAPVGGLRRKFHWVPLLKDEVSAYVTLGTFFTDDGYARATVTVYNKKDEKKSTTETIRDNFMIIEGWDFCTNKQMVGVVLARGSIAAPKHSNPNLLPIGETFGFVVFLNETV